MNILVVGELPLHAEFKAKFKDNHPTVYKNSSELAREDVVQAQVIFDFYSQQPGHRKLYAENKEAHLFINTVKTTLVQLELQHHWPHFLIGFNGLPSLFNRPLLEVTLKNDQDPAILATICETLKTEYVLVKDRVGMVTPRIICMIINEAFYTVQEGTAAADDINLGMKLGTRYPAGPFEFCEALGVVNVYEVLAELYADTGDERYKICAQLKRAYLEAQ